MCTSDFNLLLIFEGIHVSLDWLVGWLFASVLSSGQSTCNFGIQVLTAIGNFCIVSIAIGIVIEIIVMYPIQKRKYRDGIDNLLVLLIGGIPIAMPTVLSVTMAIGSHRLSQQVFLCYISIVSIGSTSRLWPYDFSIIMKDAGEG